MDDKAGKESNQPCPKDSDAEQYGLADALFAGLVEIANAIRYHADRTGDQLIDGGEPEQHNYMDGSAIK